ncbi:hypothetical protein [Hymenobacter terricola]|uniref:hypothetical protein n=1 Tax=Hymenobacter terricola TaxID=2819236 RepID=UPI001B300563|nr:hypothetical protein [Hymenobacter terricola]
MHTTFSLTLVPNDLPAHQRALWQRRQLAARNTLEVQVQAGGAVDAETVACFQRYVKGEISLSQAIAKSRQQAAQQCASRQQLLSRRQAA